MSLNLQWLLLFGLHRESESVTDASLMLTILCTDNSAPECAALSTWVTITNFMGLNAWAAKRWPASQYSYVTTSSICGRVLPAVLDG